MESSKNQSTPVTGSDVKMEDQSIEATVPQTGLFV